MSFLSDSAKESGHNQPEKLKCTFSCPIPCQTGSHPFSLVQFRFGITTGLPFNSEQVSEDSPGITLLSEK